MSFLSNSQKLSRIKLKATTILECIVASVIFMIVFVLAMDILTRILISNHKDNEFMVIESAFSRCIHEMKDCELTLGERTADFEWGKIHITISSYREELFLIQMKAITHEKREVNYQYLAVNDFVSQ